jgi:hypothetical protein
MLQVQQDKTRHIKVDFHLLQNKKKNCRHKQAMKETWSDDSDFSSSDDKDHVADMCLMAIKSDNDVLFWMMSLASLMMNHMMHLNHCMMNLKS